MDASLIAHQGGWDEALLVLFPIGFIFIMLYLAKRKAERRGPSSPENLDGAAAHDPVRASDGDT